MMKRLNITYRITAALMLLATVLTTATGCKDNDDNTTPNVKEGVVFEFSLKAVYEVESLDEVSSIKVTLKKGAERIELPSLNFTGNDQLISSQAANLPAGEYEIISYKMYDATASMIYEAYVDEDNKFTVASGAITKFEMPFKIKIIHDLNYVKNALYALCLEVFGEDQSLWPWDMKEDVEQWKHVEFVYDDYDNVLYLGSLTFDGATFGPMKALPSSITSLGTLEQLTLTNLPELTTLPGELEKKMHIQGVTLINCPKFTTFPANFFKQPDLSALTVVNCGLTEVPAEITQSEVMCHIDFTGNKITTLPDGMGGMNHLTDVLLGGNPLASIGENVFKGAPKLSHIDLSRTNLTSLPASLASAPMLKGVVLNDCQFTSVPDVLKSSTSLVNLWLANNKLAAISAADFSGMTKIEGLYLSGNKLGTFPKLTNAKLLALDVAECNLTTLPDVSTLPELRALYVGGNLYTALTAINLSANKKLRILSFENSSALTALPQDFGFEFADSKLVSFAHMNVGNCPKLVWTTPASWKCVDVDSNPSEVIDVEQGNPFPFQGRVSIYRKGSNGVTIGQ